MSTEASKETRGETGMLRRIEALERRVRRWQRGAWACGVVAVVGITVAAALPPKDLVRCKRLEVVGLTGGVAVQLATSARGDGVLTIRDGAGREVLRLPADKLAATTPEKARSVGIIESRIQGQFRGYTFGRIFELENGQLWEQRSREVSIAVRVNPKVTVYRSSRGWNLHVQGELRPVLVQPVR